MTRFARVDMDSVAPLLPGDKVAGRVAARGEHFEWKPKDGRVHQNEPIKTRPIGKGEKESPEFVDLTGKRIGRLSVMGLAVDGLANRASWVVRCVCGSYELRKSRYIKACIAGTHSSPDEPMCTWCAKTQRLRDGYHDQKKAAAAANAIKQAAATRDAK